MGEKKSKVVWVVKGIGSDNPEKLRIYDNETVWDIKKKYASELKVRENEIQVTTDEKHLNNDNVLVFKELEEGDTINILPRASAGC